MKSPRLELPGPRLPMAVQTALYGLVTPRYLRWCQRRYGDIFRLELPGGAQMVVVADPAAIKEIFALEADSFDASAAAPMLEPFVGRHSLLLLDGDRHHDERRWLARALTADGMAAHRAAVTDAITREVASWPVDEPFALWPRMRAVTLDVILERVIGAGADNHADRGLRAALAAWLEQAGSLAVLAPFLRRELSGHSPWGRFVRLRSKVDVALDQHIAARRIDPDRHGRTDVLSIMVATAADHREISDAEIRDEMLTMLAAGHDTTATALAWAFDLLLHHRDALDRLRAELDTGDHAYLGAVIKEVLRLRPVIDTVGRAMTRQLTVGGYVLPAGTVVAPSILLAGRNPDRYPEPDAFRPERFIGQPADPCTWLPFGGGIRRCIGAAFATTEIETVLRAVVTMTDLHAARPHLERTRRRAVTLIPAHGTPVVVDAVHPTPIVHAATALR